MTANGDGDGDGDGDTLIGARESTDIAAGGVQLQKSEKHPLLLKQASRRGKALRRVLTLDQAMTDANPSSVRTDESVRLHVHFT